MLDKPRLTLRDGTTMDDLINVEKHEVSLRVMNDPELHRIELERIFAKTWLLLGHDTEIPKAGDFIVRDMAEDQVIVSRDRSGDVNVVLNVCPHRGMKVCTAEAGNAAAHRCNYHGWAFKPNGDFIGAPVEKEKMYGDMLPKAELGLRKARVALYGGLIFATWNIDGPSFDEFLGESKFYFDQLFCRTDNGLELLGPPQRFMINANWKIGSEQSASDGFHTLTLHRSLMEGGIMGGTAESIYDMAPGMYGVDVSCEEGHSLRCLEAAQTFKMFSDISFEGKTVDERLHMLMPPGITPELIPQLHKNLSPDQVEMLATIPPQVGGMFPNILVLFIFAPRTDGGASGVLALHAYIPRGPDHFEFVNYIFAEKDAPEQVKRDMLQNAIQQSGTSGTIEQDDSDTWPQIHRNTRGAIGRQSTLKYQALTGHSRPDGWTGGGLTYPGFTKDDTQWNWWLNYRRLMNIPA
ncbi:aromatic ring-hydroxylating dioxygenase subunit alpha [Sphingomonas sp. 28-63-12]|uniref:aromatic ring-hydroxylating dioxygenase subunit alpha n=1 Tax=Sphingomonas sp. 28-63-12 TaxID=1970434 RepID=UPI000BD6EBB4|nr:MAG: aromatic ring-hydroxylating dioxygenase subunit alpha [Sphingomonas sp. 28-63-12]